jgi:hypothetical protein
MYARSNNLKWPLVAIAWLAAALVPEMARGEGSISFNGDLAGTSKVLNEDANVLAESDTMTITAWVKAAGVGEGGFGTVLRLDEGGQIVLQHQPSANKYGFAAVWKSNSNLVVATWTFDAIDNQWTCLQVTYDKSAVNNDPLVYVDGTAVAVTPGSTQPSGTPPVVEPGYSVGNDESVVVTWDGELAHVQVHNRILSKAELDACRQAPGSVLQDLRLWLPMPKLDDTKDLSGLGFDGTPTDVTTGTDGPVLSLTRDMLSGNRILPAGITALAQHIIPRFHNGMKHPSGELRGWGAKSIIAATTTTQNQPNKAIVVTEGNHVDPPEDISEWQNGSAGPPPVLYGADPAVLQPTLADCTIIGYIENYNWTQTGDVNDQPRIHNLPVSSHPDKYNGFDLYGNGGTIRNVGVFGIPGTAGIVTRRGSNREGFQLEHDRLRWHLDHLYARRCFRGFNLNATDMYCGHIEVEAVRDWGVKLGSSVQFGVIHVYGCGYAAPLSAGGGAAVWITGQQNLGGPLYVENSQIGLYDAGQNTTINAITSHTCQGYNVLLAGFACKLNSVDLRSAPINIRFEGDQNIVSNGKIQIAEAGAGIQYEDGPNDDNASSFNNVHDVLISGYGDKDGDGDVNGQPSEGGGAATGEEYSENGIGIDVNTQLKWVHITGVLIGQCTKGIDFSGGGSIANDGSVIWINTLPDLPGVGPEVDGYVPTPVTWPDGQTWDTMPNEDDTRDIRINGVRWYQQDL